MKIYGENVHYQLVLDPDLILVNSSKQSLQARNQ